MKCPQCGYTTFDHVTECNKCGVDFSQPYVKKRLQLSVKLPKWNLKKSKKVDPADAPEFDDETEGTDEVDQADESYPSTVAEEESILNSSQQVEEVEAPRVSVKNQESTTSVILATTTADITLKRSDTLESDNPVKPVPPTPFLKKNTPKRPTAIKKTRNDTDTKNTVTKNEPPEIGSGAPSLHTGKHSHLSGSGTSPLESYQDTYSEPSPEISFNRPPTQSSTISHNSAATFSPNLPSLPSLKEFESEGRSNISGDRQTEDETFDVGSLPTPPIVAKGVVNRGPSSELFSSPPLPSISSPTSAKTTPARKFQSPDLPSLNSQPIGGFQDSSLDAFSSPQSPGDNSGSLFSVAALQSSAPNMPELKDVSGQEQLPTKFSFGSTIDVKPKVTTTEPDKPNQRAGHTSEMEEPDTQEMVSELNADKESFGSKIRNILRTILLKMSPANTEQRVEKSRGEREIQNYSRGADGASKEVSTVGLRKSYREIRRRYGFTITVICSVITPFLSMVMAAILYGYSVAGLPVSEQYVGGVLLVAAFAFLPYPIVVYCCWRAVQRRVLVAEGNFVAASLSLLALFYLLVPNDPASKNLFLFLPAGQWGIIAIYTALSNVKMQKRESIIDGADATDTTT